MTEKLPKVVIYSKDECCLCDVAKENMLKVKEEIPFILEEFDITTNEEIFEKYKYLIPVVIINDEKTLVSKITTERFREELEKVRI
jgi:hypothetical protein